MAVDTFPLVQDQRLIAAKIETTTGTPIALTSSAGAVNAYMVSDGIVDETDMIRRQGEGSSSMLASVAGKYWGSVEFETDCAGGGASGTSFDVAVLFLACGYVNTGGVLSPVTGASAAVTITIGVYTDGLLQQLAGCMGTVSTVWRAGEPAKWRWKFWGVIQADTDVALLTPTYPTIYPPRWAGSTNTFASVAMRCNQMTFDLNNTVVPRPDPSNAGGVRSAIITHRDPFFELDPETPLVATFDWLTYFRNGTLAALSFVLGTSANNTITLAAAQAQVVTYPLTNRDGIMARNIRLEPKRNGSTYDSEHTITYS